MPLLIGDKAPNFKIPYRLEEIELYTFFKDRWGILLSIPNELTPICLSELAQIANLKASFDEKKVAVLAIGVGLFNAQDNSVDESHFPLREVGFPVITDCHGEVASLYTLLQINTPKKSGIRSVFIIDPYKTIRLIMSYPVASERNFKEVLRVIDALQLTYETSLATPADWKQGEDVIIVPTLSTFEAKRKYAKGVTIITPYLRFTPMP